MYCIVQYVGSKNKQARRVCSVAEIYRRDERTSLFLPCTPEEIQKNTDEITFRLKQKGPDGKNVYSHVIILAVKDTKQEANAFIEDDRLGRGARVKVPNLKKFTPENVRSAKKAKQQQVAMAKESMELKALTKTRKEAIAKAKKDNESRIKMLSVVVEKRVPSSPSNPPEPIDATKVQRSLPKVIGNIPCAIDYTIADAEKEIEAQRKYQLYTDVTSTTNLRKAIYQVPTQTSEFEGSVVAALKRIFYKLQLNKKTVTTNDLTKNIDCEVFQLSKQQDVHEFLQLLLNNLKSEEKGTCVDYTISKLFEGTMISTIKCKNINVTRRKVEKFSDIQLTIIKKKNVYESFQDYVKAEILDGSNKYLTDWNGLQVAEKTIIFEHFPPVLFLHLLRFIRNPKTHRFEKCNDRFEFYEKINLGPYMRDNECVGDANYTLHSVLVHSGEKNTGHYVVFIDPRCDGKWKKFNDDIVSSCTKQAAIQYNYGGSRCEDVPITMDNCTNAYMLVYIRDSELHNVLQEVSEEDVLETITDIVQKDEANTTEESRENTYVGTSEKNRENTYVGTSEKSRENTYIGTSEKSHEDTDVGTSNEDMDCDRNFRQQQDTPTFAFNKHVENVKEKAKYSEKKMDVPKRILFNEKNNRTKKKKDKRIQKERHTSAIAEIIPSLKKMEKRILSAINCRSLETLPTAFNSAGGAEEPPLESNADGKVIVLEGILIDYEAYLKAVDASTMKKRVNAVIDGLWPLEERLMLTVDNKKRNSYKRISRERLQNIRDICLHLQKHRALSTSKDHNIYFNLTKWISDKLKTDRYRNSEKFKSRSCKKQRNMKENEKRRETDSTCSSAEETNSVDSRVKHKKLRKTSRLVVQSSDSENEP